MIFHSFQKYITHSHVITTDLYYAQEIIFQNLKIDKPKHSVVSVAYDKLAENCHFLSVFSAHNLANASLDVKKDTTREKL